MPIVIDDAFLPAILDGHPMTDEEFAAFCSEHPDLNFEMTAEAEIIAMAPTNYFTGVSNSAVNSQLDVFPNGAGRSADAAWTSKARIKSLEARKRRGFLHLCPDFAIEIRSDSDRLKTLRLKMREYIDNGSQLGWLIDPATRTVEVHSPDNEPALHSSITSIAGEGLVAGFVLDLTHVWDPLAD